MPQDSPPPTEPFPEEIYLTFCGIINGILCQRIFDHYAVAINGGAKTIHLLLQSPGGDISDGIALYNYIRNAPLKTHTYNGGNIASAAVLPYMAGEVRNASPLAIFLIHKTSFASQVPLTSAMMKVRTGALNIDDINVERVLKESLRIPEEKWQIHQWADLTFTAQEAVEIGLAHALVDFAPPKGARIFNLMA